jgi:hypothetical protein
LGLINTIAFLHQYQRPVKRDDELGEYIEVSQSDIELANRLLNGVLEDNIDELPPQTLNVLESIHGYVKGICEQNELGQQDVLFSRRELREFLRISDTVLRKHISRLVELEYLVVHRGKRGSSYVYELVYNYDEKFAPPSLPVRPQFARGSLPQGSEVNGSKINGLATVYTKSVKNAYIPQKI